MSNFKGLARSFVCTLQYAKSFHTIPVRGIKRWVAPTLMEIERRRKRLGPQPPTPRSSFIEWNYQSEWYAFGKRLHEEFDDQVLQRAFTHRSYILKEKKNQEEAGIENPEVNLEDNKELIDAGERFMKEYIRKYVSLLLPRFPEEGIQATCSYLLDEKVLAHVSQHLGTKDLILSADTPPGQETLSLTLKAIIGALLNCSGAERAGLFVSDFIVTQLVQKDVNDLWAPEDPLTTLSNILEKEGRGIPEPRLINEAGRNTILASFQVALYSDKQFLGSGNGETIPIATHQAAHNVLRKFFNTTDNMAPFSFNLNPYSEEIKPSSHTSIDEWSCRNIVNC